MRTYLVAAFAALAQAKPHTVVSQADGRIIGGEEAPPHKYTHAQKIFESTPFVKEICSLQTSVPGYP